MELGSVAECFEAARIEDAEKPVIRFNITAAYVLRNGLEEQKIRRNEE